jgi:hypothetical protein
MWGKNARRFPAKKNGDPGYNADQLKTVESFRSPQVQQNMTLHHP